MSNFALARALTTGITVAALTTPYGFRRCLCARYGRSNGRRRPEGDGDHDHGQDDDHPNHESPTTTGAGSSLSARVTQARRTVASTSEQPGVRQESVAISTDRRRDNAR